MKRAVPILLFILILVLWQTPMEPVVQNPHAGRASLQGSGLIHHPKGLGWKDAMNNDDPQEVPAVFEAFQDEAPLYLGRTTPELFICTFHAHVNLLLIDRPPPVRGA